ncbi:hypothetical protein [Dictyobacter aurantiacus]|uniref:Uncharacterized protein n=1 Tax=Dictyobacter aurantiacus TaxID=1936993 RepID=A0A401ZM23_9CHLR|nr:hypothetical protein [Dictyobacter aurantiacus]GCE07939.1 hypothetical protein KDAU_52680 [Dictyobacter aurantiacus]
MVHRHPTLYRTVGLVFFGITVALISIGVALDWPASTRTALFILSFFPLLLALMYVHLGTEA